MSYKSPIEIVMGQMESKIENEIYSEIQKVGIYVDKEELIKALKYDRDQYYKGYNDGYNDRDKEIAQYNGEQSEQEENL